jgi:predicted transcriptional regulator
MTRSQLIKLIGDTLTKMDVLRGSLLPNDPNRKTLDAARKELDRLQLKLSKELFDDNTAEFKKASQQLESINNNLKQTIKDLKKIVDTLDNINRFIGAVDGIVKAVLP